MCWLMGVHSRKHGMRKPFLVTNALGCNCTVCTWSPEAHQNQKLSHNQLIPVGLGGSQVWGQGCLFVYPACLSHSFASAEPKVHYEGIHQDRNWKPNAKDEVIMFFNQTQGREEVRTASWSLLPAALPPHPYTEGHIPNTSEYDSGRVCKG